MNEITVTEKVAEKKTGQLRELAFHELETSHATLRKLAGLMNVRDPLVRHMSQVLGVAENSLRILESNPTGEIKVLTGPIHGEDETREVDVSVVSSNGTTEHQPQIANGPAAHTIAHARKLNHCGARNLGCSFKTHGNSYGRHQQLCEYFQTARLLQAGYKIDSFEDFVKGLKKENGGEIGASADGLRASIERRHGSYRKLLVEVKQGLKQHGGTHRA